MYSPRSLDMVSRACGVDALQRRVRIRQRSTTRPSRRTMMLLENVPRQR
jgi:hypothetical protein